MLAHYPLGTSVLAGQNLVMGRPEGTVGLWDPLPQTGPRAGAPDPHPEEVKNDPGSRFTLLKIRVLYA